MTVEPLRVSDHALVRYMERIKGVSLDEYRHEIVALAAAHENKPRPANADKYLTFVIDIVGSPVVATVLGYDQRRKNRRFGNRVIYVPSDRVPTP